MSCVHAEYGEGVCGYLSAAEVRKALHFALTGAHCLSTRALRSAAQRAALRA